MELGIIGNNKTLKQGIIEKGMTFTTITTTAQAKEYKETGKTIVMIRKPKGKAHQLENYASVIILDEGKEPLKTKIQRALNDIKEQRPGWDDYFLAIVEAVRRRATCDRQKTGCVITKNNRILATGYVGSPTGLPHCDEAGHLITDVINDDKTVSKQCVRTIHAEQNAIAQAARHGVAIEGATMYCYLEPCYNCAKILINAGIKRVVAAKAAPQPVLSRKVLKAADVKLEIKNPAVG